MKYNISMIGLFLKFLMCSEVTKGAKLWDLNISLLDNRQQTDSRQNNHLPLVHVHEFINRNSYLITPS